MGRFRRRSVKIILGAAAAVIAARAALPWAVETAVNRALAKHQSIAGSVGDVDLELWRGAYQLDGLVLARREPAGSRPFFAARTADFSVDWSALFDGRFLAKGRLLEPLVDLGAFPESDQADAAKEEADEVADAVMPVRVSHLEVEKGTLRFPPREGSPLGALELRELRGHARDIRVTEDPGNRTPTKVSATALTPGDGRLALNLSYDPFSDPIRFDVDASLENVDLPKLNPLIRSTLGMDVQSGRGSVYAEAKAENGRFQGYVKPILDEVNVLSGGENASLGQKVKEGLTDVVKNVFENQKQDTVAARVPFSGSFDDPAVGVWTAVGTVLRHAFIRALRPKVDDRI